MSAEMEGLNMKIETGAIIETRSGYLYMFTSEGMWVDIETGVTEHIKNLWSDNGNHVEAPKYNIDKIFASIDFWKQGQYFWKRKSIEEGAAVMIKSSVLQGDAYNSRSRTKRGVIVNSLITHFKGESLTVVELEEDLVKVQYGTLRPIWVHEDMLDLVAESKAKPNAQIVNPFTVHKSKDYSF